ncbi:MAG: LPS-assembly protein LptD [Campylobacterota bacterium]|nr:LPS-assembly protein LptD [Campylobacterota bacterium]
MNRKFLISTLIVIQCITASAELLSENEPIQILSEQLTSNNEIVNATGKVTAYSSSYYITADSLVYDKINSTMELKGGVSIVKNNELVSYSEYAFIDLGKKISKSNPLLVIDNKNEIWFNSQESKRVDDTYNLTNSTLSSCDCDDPDWSIGFSSGDYNTQSKWINTYNTTLYIKNMPILYSPYFGFSTDRTRKSGLLRPTIGYGKKEGLLYAQPIYYAPALNYDFEYIPQIRTKRGHGHTLRYRLADSYFSHLNLEAGVFKEQNEYRQEALLQNDKHHGFTLDYIRTKLFSSMSSSDGLLISLENANDIDYINTKYDSDSFVSIDKNLKSEVKYFYNTNEIYSELEMKYYDNLSLDNNDEILQQIPSLTLHKYSDNILLDKLIYSMDIQYINKTRKTGIDAQIFDLYIPISYTMSFFDDYLNLTLAENIQYTAIDYDNFNGQNFKDAKYGENAHVVSLSTDLIKPYENYLHTMNLYTSYTYTSSYEESGDIYGVNNSNSDLGLFEIVKSKKNLTMGLKQSFYDIDSLEEIVNHKIEQAYIYNEITDVYENNDLLNDLSIFYDYGILRNRILYNHKYDRFSSSTTQFTYDYSRLYFELYHLFEDDFVNDINDKETLTYKLAYDLTQNYMLSYQEEYDIYNNNNIKKELALYIKKKCWDMSLKFIDALVPTDTTTVNNTLALRQKKVYVEFDLKQLLELNHVFELNRRSE